MGKRTSARKKPVVRIAWRFRFWWPDDEHNDKDGIPGNRLNKGGFEMMGANRVTVDFLRDGAVLQKDGAGISKKGGMLIDISQLVVDCAAAHGTGAYTIRLTPPADLSSSAAAGPHMEEPSGKLNGAYRIQMRPLEFNVELDSAGEILAPAEGTRVFMPYSEADRPDGEPAPHGSVIRKRHDGEIHFVVDWKFDWINRHQPKYRPLRLARTRKDGSDHPDVLVLHITGGARIESALQKFLKEGGKIGIHYIVDLDGHAVKLVEEQHALSHAGFKDGRGKALLDKKGWERQEYNTKWGMFDRGESSAVFLRSIGIEHQIGEDAPFPDGMVAGCVRLVKQIVNHFGIDPWNVVGHADVLTLKGKNRLPRGGSQVAFEEFTKNCPGTSFPWNHLQDFKEGGKSRPLSLGPAAGIDPEPKETIYAGVFVHLDRMDANAPSESVAALQTLAIEQLQKDLRRMGFWCPGWKSSPRKIVTSVETFGELDFGTYDLATRGAVRLFQRRCMLPRGDKVSEAGRVDLLTAQRIRQTVATPGLPELVLPRTKPSE
ncbi:N-acetylmuramoyl-L-alanine amidase [Luteimonas salinilitoris]|uniref:N-acetylmuramoyl-L-alanine amidase n=1 Tax=Luteimonas salinilitoris TaxID=3237697 RepID=A0ABV4HTU4_9GAMM